MLSSSHINNGNNSQLDSSDATKPSDAFTTPSLSFDVEPSQIEAGQASPTATESTDPIKNEDQHQPQEESTSMCKRYRVLIAGLLLCAVVAAVVSTLTTRDNESSTASFDLLDPSSWLPSLLDHLDYNPHGGDTPYDFSLWNTGRSCKGLEINVVDNVDERWKPYLTQAVSDWDNGSPDALTIRVRQISVYDPECTPVRNVLKVCNGDYGDTDWVGINVAIVVNDYISSSVAKMNDYHLDRMREGSMQWTMCHELGHGFGLGHWDEKFYNRDLGNCMDYTARPERNQKPDVSNFVFLEQMYGSVDGTSQYSATSVVNGTERLHCKSGELFNRRSLADSADSSSSLEANFDRYLQYVPSNPVIDRDTSSMHHPQAHLGWRYLSRSKHAEVHELEIEDGVKIVTTISLSQRER
ncbi:hypothetical protein HJC23_012562 [Cyclotella cryptica]|uniref:Peptidase M11 gametolysin domain-containing protein n=1 Tax=Cyclotella cryptica TaxID=29204 RepID=A0ABD3QQW7_9STRA|eukprot:CCRYP_003231-RA/>CCRYP_003231-RA protein AED:0.35 eAED:0.35 QI:404/-1/1/1/-1/1/1/156/410